MTHPLDLCDAYLGPGVTTASMVLIVAALVLLVFVSVLVPPRLGISVLISWIATSAAVAIYYSTLFAEPNHNDMWINFFLLVLAGFAVIAAAGSRGLAGAIRHR